MIDFNKIEKLVLTNEKMARKVLITQLPLSKSELYADIFIRHIKQVLASDVSFSDSRYKNSDRMFFNNIPIEIIRCFVSYLSSYKHAINIYMRSDIKYDENSINYKYFIQELVKICHVNCILLNKDAWIDYDSPYKMDLYIKIDSCDDVIRFETPLNCVTVKNNTPIYINSCNILSIPIKNVLLHSFIGNFDTITIKDFDLNMEFELEKLDSLCCCLADVNYKRLYIRNNMGNNSIKLAELKTRYPKLYT